MKLDFDVVIVGASFSGLTLAHHLPEQLRVLVIDVKPGALHTVESTGLITVKTREEFSEFFPIDQYITNPITTICVVAPDFQEHFFSTTSEPWIYQTDTRGLMKHLAETLPEHVTHESSALLVGVDRAEDDSVHAVDILQGGVKHRVATRFLVGADGGRSKVASLVSELDCNTHFLMGCEKVFFGEVYLGPNPEETIYHFWFGEFSLGYGGWLSPTIIDGKKAFRIGLAKLQKDVGEIQDLLTKFTKLLVDNGTITIDGNPEKPHYAFGSPIPMSGALTRVSHKNILLIGDAAGLCGAFAADGIKGSVVSGKVSASLIESFLNGDVSALSVFHDRVNEHGNLMEYYKRQVRYRWIWDRMKSNRTFRAMYNIIAAERDSFLDQFCDSKDKRKSLVWVVLKFKHLWKLIVYSWYIFLDFFVRR